MQWPGFQVPVVPEPAVLRMSDLTVEPSRLGTVAVNIVTDTILTSLPQVKVSFWGKIAFAMNFCFQIQCDFPHLVSSAQCTRCIRLHTREGFPQTPATLACFCT